MVRSLIVAAALVGMSSASHASNSNVIDFNTMNVGSLTTANPGYSSGDGRVAGGALNAWWVNGNTASIGSIVAGQGLLGGNALAMQRRVANNGDPSNLDGVIAGVVTPRLSNIAGESIAPVGASFSRFEFSYWMRPAANVAREGFRFGAEAWGPGNGTTDRNTWHRFIAEPDGSGGQSLNFYSVGTINNPGLGYFPAADTTIATNLDWNAWYQVRVAIDFVDGGDDNDVVTTQLFDINGMQVGVTGIDTTWESGWRYASFYGATPTDTIGVDSINFVVRAGNTPFGNSMPGTDLVYIDSVTYAAVPTPGTAAVLALGGLFAARRRRA